eukprot:GDKH01010312.1.p3 GENE.GDKH01010312.1~~GDKH01010312.1.p3  ORF type:complete len:51 (+),score=0.40 GDKH01010312.1:122-274(+)
MPSITSKRHTRTHRTIGGANGSTIRNTKNHHANRLYTTRWNKTQPEPTPP